MCAKDNIFPTYVVSNEMEMVHDEIRRQLPQKLLISSHQLHITHTIGHGKQNTLEFF